ncbi:hypothetical protein LJC57_01540 [Parabacteroides sp. OttesenSCG-928-G07]|nr:hypothetical protein [Parabacteroides sp. OttesenSCG-928-G07]
MLRRDFIMVQIEELGKVIAQIISFRNTSSAHRIPELIQDVHDTLDISRDFLMNTAPDDIRRFLDKEDSGGILRMEIAVKALMEESYLLPDQQRGMLLRAKELLEYIQQTDKTFSLERIALIKGIEDALKEI